MPLMYICTQHKCNRKYKTREKLLKHLVLQHKVIVKEDEIFTQVEITKENKRSVGTEKR